MRINIHLLQKSNQIYKDKTLHKLAEYFKQNHAFLENQPEFITPPSSIAEPIQKSRSRSLRKRFKKSLSSSASLEKKKKKVTFILLRRKTKKGPSTQNRIQSRIKSENLTRLSWKKGITRIINPATIITKKNAENILTIWRIIGRTKKRNILSTTQKRNRASSSHLISQANTSMSGKTEKKNTIVLISRLSSLILLKS